MLTAQRPRCELRGPAHRHSGYSPLFDVQRCRAQTTNSSPALDSRCIIGALPLFVMFHELGARKFVQMVILSRVP